MLGCGAMQPVQVCKNYDATDLMAEDGSVTSVEAILS